MSNSDVDSIPSARRLQAVIFDMDGLMIDTEVIYKRAWQQAAADLGFAMSDALYEATIGMRQPDVRSMMHDELGAAFPFDDWSAAGYSYFTNDCATHGIPTKPCLDALLDMLDAHGVPKAVATSAEAGDAERCLALAGLRSRFEVVVSGDMVAKGKPAPDIFLAAAARLGVRPAGCIVFEDSDYGALGAAAAGMRAYIVPDLKQPSAEARAAATDVLPSLCAAVELVQAMLAQEPA